MTLSDPTGPSVTARRVAAYRLGFDRLPAPTDDGDPDVDELLASDVAAGIGVDRASPMGRYLQARTRFFDRVTVNALSRGVTQIVAVGAGYDARALRYRTPGVRWWEVDRPVTQDDKRSRLDRLGIVPDGVTFIGLDLSEGELASALIRSGFEPDAPALFFAEGVVRYLEAETLSKMLRDIRSLATPGTRLALSLARPGSDENERARFEAGVAALGEPALGSITVDDSEAVLLAGLWRAVNLKDRATDLGFVMAMPVFAATTESMPPTVGRIGRFVEDTLSRQGGATLAAHLEATYDINVSSTRELDLGVFRIEQCDGSSWIARVFPATRTPAEVRADAEILDWLSRSGIPAERTAAPDPVSVHEGQAVLLTDFVRGRHPATKPALFEELGALLARIHGLPGDGPVVNRPGGAWHHLLLDATVSDELAAARNLLHDARHRVPPGHGADYDRLRDALATIALPSDLPAAFVHPDFVPRNIIGDGGGLTIVDWSGSGVGPRLASLGCLLWSASGHGPSLDAAARGYRSNIALEPVELEYLRPAMAIRPVILFCWSFAAGRSSVVEAADKWSDLEPKLAKAARRAGALLAEGT